ncbi:MAG: hypothetical protein K5865_10730 [Eubacterium sp.]|nr:hypothetical protein [Eubacterium sp.]
MNRNNDNKTEYAYSSDKRNKGAAMIVAIIVIAILIVFTFSLMLVTYTLYSSQTKKVASKKCSEGANTLRLALMTELTDEAAVDNSDLWIYLRCHLIQSDWPFYEPKLSGHKDADAVKTFDFRVNPNYIDAGQSTLEGFPGSVKLRVYWMLPESIYEEYGDDSDLSTLSSLDPTTFTVEQKRNIRLFIEITCEAASQSYTVTNEYYLGMGTYTDSTKDKSEKKLLNQYKNSTLYNKGDSEGTVSTSRVINTNERWRWSKTPL